VATIEQDIVDKVLELMNEISGLNVFEWRDSPLEPSELPAVIVRDTRNEVSPEDAQEHVLAMEIVLAATGDSSPADLRSWKQEVITAFKGIEAEEYVSGAAFRYSETSVEKLQKLFASALLAFEVYYYADEWNF